MPFSLLEVINLLKHKQCIIQTFFRDSTYCIWNEWPALHFPALWCPTVQQNTSIYIPKHIVTSFYLRSDQSPTRRSQQHHKPYTREFYIYQSQWRKLQYLFVRDMNPQILRWNETESTRFVLFCRCLANLPDLTTNKVMTRQKNTPYIIMSLVQLLSMA